MNEEVDAAASRSIKMTVSLGFLLLMPNPDLHFKSRNFVKDKLLN